MDIVLSTLPTIRRVGFLSSADLVPFAGGAEERAKDQGVVTALEVFGSLDGDDDGSEGDVFWIQQRSPVLKVRCISPRTKRAHPANVEGPHLWPNADRSFLPFSV